MPIKDPVARAAWQKAYQEANKERIAEVGKAYRERVRETRNAQKRAYREANRERINEKGREDWWKNREVNLAKSAEWRANNREYARNFNRRYREENLEKLKAKQKEYRNGPKRDEFRKKKAEWSYANYRKDIEASRAKANERMRKDIEELAPSYVAVLLQIPRKVLTPELIEAKRVQMLIQRKIKEIENEPHQ